jgi:hypothetical protein
VTNSIFKIRRRSDGLYRLTGTTGYNANGRSHSQISHARRAVKCACPSRWLSDNGARRNAFLADHEIVEFEVIERAVHPVQK